MLAETRKASRVRERQRTVHAELDALDNWEARWGYPGKAVATDAPSRRRADPTLMKPSLVGYGL